MRHPRLRMVLAAVVIAVVSVSPRAGGPDSGEPIRIGLTLGLTGQYANESGYMHEAYRLWEEQVNRRGGLLGRRVQLAILDDQSSPAESARLYQRLIVTDGVRLVLGPYSSAVTLAASEAVESLGYPMVAAGAAAAEIWQRGFRHTIGIHPVAASYFEGMIELAAERGVKRVAMLQEKSLFPASAAAGAMRLATDHGMEIPVQETYASPLQDARPMLLAVRRKAPDILLVAGYFTEAKLIARQAREVDLRLKAIALSVGVAIPEFARDLGDDAEYVFGPSLWEPALRTPGNQEFVEAYRARWGRPPGYHAATAWAGATVLETAVGRTGSLDRRRLLRVLYDLQMETILPGAFEVDRTGLQVGHQVLTVQWQLRQKEVVWPRRYATARPVFPAPPWRRR